MTSRERTSVPVAAILVRHAHPEVQPDRPAGVWPLRPEGWQSAQALGRRLRAFGLLQVVTSDEVKAIQTGEALIPKCDVTTDARFGEQGQGTVPFLPGDAFHERAIDHFRHPEERILGDETSSEAAARFDAAFRDVRGRHEDRVPVIVAHGRIISAWLVAHAVPGNDESVPAEALWASLRMPDAFLLRPHTGHADVGIPWTWERLAIAPEMEG